MTRKTKGDDSSPLPPHRARPLAVAQDQPAEQIPAAYGLSVEIYLAAPGVCSDCDEPADRISVDGSLCSPCTDLWDTRDRPRRRAS